MQAAQHRSDVHQKTLVDAMSGLLTEGKRPDCRWIWNSRTQRRGWAPSVVMAHPTSTIDRKCDSDNGIRQSKALASDRSRSPVRLSRLAPVPAHHDSIFARNLDGAIEP